MPFRSSTRLVEDTDDWYGQRKDGTVDFCGEAVSNFETFPEDNSVRPERVNTDGQWKTGRDGDPSGMWPWRDDPMKAAAFEVRMVARCTLHGVVAAAAATSIRSP